MSFFVRLSGGPEHITPQHTEKTDIPPKAMKVDELLLEFFNSTLPIQTIYFSLIATLPQFNEKQFKTLIEWLPNFFEKSLKFHEEQKQLAIALAEVCLKKKTKMIKDLTQVRSTRTWRLR